MRWKLQPPLLAGIMLALAVALHRYGPPLPLPRVPVVGWPLLVAGILFGGWARITFTRKTTSLFVGDSASHLVAQGPFQFSRNPMYLGITICCAAFGLVAGSAYYAAAAAVFFVIIATAYVPFEENVLRQKFGNDYEAYCQKVRRWI